MVSDRKLCRFGAVKTVSGASGRRCLFQLLLYHKTAYFLLILCLFLQNKFKFNSEGGPEEVVQYRNGKLMSLKFAYLLCTQRTEQFAY